ncbi:hypothetical protein MMC12_008372 [Toensbergia leucococca]|nr:hypothetical protein [Toensbergia leucococca]
MNSNSDEKNRAHKGRYDPNRTGANAIDTRVMADSQRASSTAQSYGGSYDPNASEINRTGQVIGSKTGNSHKGRFDPNKRS